MVNYYNRMQMYENVVILTNESIIFFTFIVGEPSDFLFHDVL